MAPSTVYLNHAGTSWPKPPIVAEAVLDAMQVSPAQWPGRFEAAHGAVAEYFGVSNPEQILLTPGCTSALAAAVGDMRITEGKRVLTSCWEHHALHRPLLKLAANGIPLDIIPACKRGAVDGHASPVDLNWLENEVAKQDVELVAITAACNVTGELLPYEDVIEIAHRHGAKVLIDAAQVVGWLELDFPRLGADLVAFGGHKGLQAPWGIGGLYLAQDIQMECTSATCALPATAGKTESSLPLPRPGYCDVGSVDQFALAGLHAAITMLRSGNCSATLAAARNQIAQLRQTLQRIEGIQIWGSPEPHQAMPSLAFSVSGCRSLDVALQLSRRGLVVGSGLQCSPLAHQSLGTQKSGLVRLSVGVGQPDTDIDEASMLLQSTLTDNFCQPKHQ